MTNYIELENLPITANHLLNVLWSRNVEMELAELLHTVNTEFSVTWERRDIEHFLLFLISEDYIAVKRRGFKTYYFALGMADEQ